jgi:hypothetical protein
MANDIVCENSKPGNPPSDWDVSGAGDLTIQGFATDISVNQGQTINFKINTNASAYTIEIYRMGYYGGMGARRIASFAPSAKLPQTQPNCITQSSTGLVDCGNWAVSASWTVPSNATSGIYFAHLIRTDTGGDSHIVFIVRNDSSHSSILFQTADETWQAYNGYGAGSLYGPNGDFDLSNRSFKVSYNRPVLTRGFDFESATWVFGAEYPMVRWLEENGYDVTYFTGIDAARYGNLILNHTIYMDSSHDEYWSGPHRANVQAAQNAGVNMAFFAGNEVFWKTRLENSIDGTNTPDRTLVCYKETLGPLSAAGSGPSAQIDPMDPPTWTGTWRDPSFSPPDDGGAPENALTGNIFMVNGPGTDNDGLAIKVPAADGKMRFWRNTTIANLSAGQTATLPDQTLGYEWDEDLDNGFRPAGTFDLSTATYPMTTDLLSAPSYGSTYGGGTATHHMTMHRLPSGALIFGSGTVQWSWGLDSNHDDPFGSNPPVDPDMQQATVNLFADMGVQPATLQSGLLPAAQSTDHTPPTSAISSLSSGANVFGGSTITVSGSATDSGGGVVGGVEISVDSGNTWHPASGRGSWSYAWTPSELGTFSIETRAVDDSGNIETPSDSVSVNVIPHDCPCDAWGSAAIPSNVDSGDHNSVEVGVKFRADFSGYITGIRFYKASTNTGTHVGNVWSSSGTLLGSAIFTNETASGWQQVNFSNPVPISANTTYIASYFAPVGHYSADLFYFQSSGIDDPPIHLLQNGVDGPNGVYHYGTSSGFPSSTFDASNYWVDVVYMPAQSMPGAPPALVVGTTSLSFLAGVGLANPPAQSVSIYNQGTSSVSWTASSNASWLVVTPSSGTLPQTLSISVNTSGLAAGNYTGTVTVTASGAANSPQTISVSLSVTNFLLATNFANQGAQGWVVSPLGLASNWSVVNGAMQFSGGGNSQIYAGNSSWTDYAVNVPFELTGLQDWPGGIRGRVNPATGAGYMAWVYPALSEVILYKASGWSINSGLTELGSATAAFDTANYHNLKLVFSGTQVQVQYDGKTIISVSDSTYASGLIVLEGLNQTIKFGNVVATSATIANTGTITSGTNSMSFATDFGLNPAPQTAQVTAGGGGVLAWTAVSNAPWLVASPTGGNSPSTLQVSVTSAALAAGSYSGTVTVFSLGATNLSQTINVSLSVVVPPPSIVPTPSSMSFMSILGQTPPPAQALVIANGAYGGSSFGYTLSSDSPWLSATPSSGSTPGSATVGVNTSGLATATYYGNVIVTAPGISNSPQSVPVSLQVFAQDMTETFTDSGNGWVVSPMGHATDWSASNGIYSYDGSGLSQTCTGNAAWTDYTFDSQIKLSTLANWPGGIRARVNPSTGAGYIVWLYPGSGIAVLYKVGTWNINDSSLTALAQAPVTFDTNGHDLQIAFRGNFISVSWDGKLLMTASDATYSSGYACLDADSQPISYSNIRVDAVQGQVNLDSLPSTLVFGALVGSNPAPQKLNVTAGGANVAWGATTNASWLLATASPALTPGVLTVSVNSSGLAQGTYTGTITVSAPGAINSPMTINVTLAVTTAAISLSPSSLTFFGAPTLNPFPQTIQVTNGGTGTLNWSASAGSSWLGFSPNSGATPATISVTPNTSNLSNGSYSDALTISAPNAANSPVAVPVSLQVGTLLFSDDFSQGAGNWTIGPLGFASGWSVANNMYSYNGEGATQSWAGNSSWTDYTVATNFQLASLNDYPGGLRGRLNTSTGSGYGAWIYPAEGVIKLYRIGQWDIDLGYSLLGQSATLKMDTNVHNLRLVFQGSTIQVYYDNVLVITATDPTYTQGAIAFDVSNQPISFSSVSVISLP